MGEFFGITAGIVGVIGYAPYARDVIKGTTTPDRIAWLIWTLEYTALFFAQVTEGAAHSLWLIGLQLLGVVIIFFLSLRHGVGAFTKHSYMLLAFVFVALLVWHTAQDAALAILILIAVEASGVVLTMIKVFKNPGSETLSFWVLIGTAGALGIPAVGLHAPAILYVYPVSLIFMSAGVVGSSLIGARRLRLANTEEELAS